MKWITQITGLTDSVLKTIREVDKLFQQFNRSTYSVKITLNDGAYKVRVFDLNGLPVDGAIVAVYLDEPRTVTSGIAGYIAVIGEDANPNRKVFWQDTTFGDQTTRKSMMLRIPTEGCSFHIVGNPNATFKACVLGKEVSVS